MKNCNELLCRKEDDFYFSFNVDNHNIVKCVSEILFDMINEKKEVVILCLGVDSLIGDSLGPFVGSILKKNGIGNVYGTLDETVNTRNVLQVLSEIYSEFKNPYIIVVDAAITASDYSNDIVLKNRGFEPGECLHSRLPKIGDISLVGVVNHEDEYENNFISLLKKCDFEIVRKMAKVISQILILTFEKLKNKENY